MSPEATEINCKLVVTNCETRKAACCHDWRPWSPEAGGIRRPSCRALCPLSNDCWTQQCVLWRDRHIVADRDSGGRDPLGLLLRAATRDAACPCVFLESLRKGFPCSGLAGMTGQSCMGLPVALWRRTGSRRPHRQRRSCPKSSLIGRLWLKMESRTSSSDRIKIAKPPCQRPGSDDVRAVAAASSTSGFPQERWQLLRKVKSKIAVCASGVGWRGVQDEAQCGSHGLSRVIVGPWLSSALAPPTGPAGVPLPDWYGTNGLVHVLLF